jgi:hypothetical protein
MPDSFLYFHENLAEPDREHGLVNWILAQLGWKMHDTKEDFRTTWQGEPCNRKIVPSSLR